MVKARSNDHDQYDQKTLGYLPNAEMRQYRRPDAITASISSHVSNMGKPQAARKPIQSEVTFSCHLSPAD